MSSTPLQQPLKSSAAPRDQEPSDWEQLKKWQEARMARKLKGEYESAVMHLSDVINNNISTPMRIDSVRLEGATNTRQSFLGSLIDPILLTSASDITLGSVLHKTRHISYILKQTDIFSSVEAKIERTRRHSANPVDVDIVFKTREKGRLYLNTSTELGNGEGNASATARVRNVFGGAETFETNVSFGTKTRRSFRASLSAPITHTLKTTGEISFFQLEQDNSSFASSTEGLRGVKAAVRNGVASKVGGAHEFTYEAVLRHIGNLPSTASHSMREVAGQTVKSSVTHSWTRDTRDDKLLSTRGLYTKLFHEFAGLGGDASFYKAKAEVQASRPLLPGINLSFAARTGLLWSFSQASLFPDRFQLGGPVSVRSFQTNGMGPRDGLDSLGGEFYWSTGLSLISDIPTKGHWPVKAHVYLNCGRLDGIDKSRTLLENFAVSLTRPSISFGTGLIYCFDPVRVEVNFGVPLVASRTDGMKKGLQVGMGLEFL